MNRPAVVLDNGSGYTKLGYSGNLQPSALIPTYIATQAGKTVGKADYVEDLDFFVGEEATVKRSNYNVDFPIREGVVSNWDNMEKYLQRCIFQYLRCDPEDHYFVMTEPPLNSPENREYTAEVMFETFNVPGLYIAVQAVLALCASILSNRNGRNYSSITGTVIDSGDGVTHVVPVVSGYVIGSCIKHLPMAGRTITDFVVEQLRSRGEPVPPEQMLDVARRIKEMYCYVGSDILKTYKKYDENPEEWIKQYKGVDIKTKQPFTVDVGYERFLGPELFFNPEIFSTDFTTPLPDVVDSAIQACPIDTRRQLYDFIALSGGSTMYKHFARRLELDLRKKVDSRYEHNVKLYPHLGLKPTPVNVVTHEFQRFAVWLGGSMMAARPDFLSAFHTREQYHEHGAVIARNNVAFRSL